MCNSIALPRLENTEKSRMSIDIISIRYIDSLGGNDVSYLVLFAEVSRISYRDDEFVQPKTKSGRQLGPPPRLVVRNVIYLNDCFDKVLIGR